MTVGLAAYGLYVVLGKRGELQGASGYLNHLRWPVVLVAGAMELASVVAFGGLQRQLLRSGGLRLGWGRITAITFAGNSITNSLPAGPAVSSVFAYRQFRQRGADDAQAVWVLLATGILASLSLAVFASFGLAVPGAHPVALNILAAVLVFLVIAALAGVGMAKAGVLGRVLVSAIKLSQQLTGRSLGPAYDKVVDLVGRVTAITPTWPQLGLASAWAMSNWVLDCSCLVLAFLAVGAGVPWAGLFLAYGAGQLAANLPITPGGLGVVEGSLTIALVAYGGSQDSTVAAVLLYRILSFWLLLPLGWAAWLTLVVKGRNHVQHQPISADTAASTGSFGVERQSGILP
ncbi:MAG: lysylphosphatidylglycerol synthase transmembrane domain-containing protein [Acidimicrobiales bacterium]